MAISNEIKAAIFVITTLALLVVSVLIMGRERQIFAKQEQFFAAFGDIKGLSPGAPVRLGGISIGRVDKVSFAKERNDPKIHVVLLINEESLDRVRSDSAVSIETQGLLGDRFINISTGVAPEVMTPGSYLKTHETGDLSEILAKAQTVVDNTVDTAKHLNAILKDFNTSAAPDIAEAAKSLKAITKEIQEGNGLIHRIIYSEKDGESIMNSVKKTADSVDSIASEVKHGQGILHTMIYGENGEELMKALIEASHGIGVFSTEIGALSTQVRDGQGILHDMIYGQSKQSIDDVIAKLNQTVDNLRIASEALSLGSGTLGALLIDPTLYDNLVEVTDNAKRSVLLRKAIQHSLGQ